jgi:xanthine dehydrogenase/oxidase
MPVLAADGCHVTTVEGIGSVKGNNLHPIQEVMVDLHGSQCGFCTPGIIMSIYSLFANDASVAHLEEHLDGNLCRCTGYRPIWDAARSLCVDVEDCFVKGPCGTACRDCPERDDCSMECNVKDRQNEEFKDDGKIVRSSSVDKATYYKQTRNFGTDWLNMPQLIFPTELIDDKSEVNLELSKPLAVIDKTEYSKGAMWFKPYTLHDLLKLLRDLGEKEGGCKIVVGNTEVGIGKCFHP